MFEDSIVKMEHIIEMESGGTSGRHGARFTFSDGSALIIYATVPQPPESELEAREVEATDDATGARVPVSDHGLMDALDLASTSTAYRAMATFVVRLSQSMPGAKWGEHGE